MSKINLVSVSEELMAFVESQGAGRQGIDLFAHDWPDDDKLDKVPCVMFVESTKGGVNRVMSGGVTSQNEYLSILGRAVSERKSRELLFPVIEVLEKVLKMEIGTSFYHSVLAACPIHFVGTDKNDLYVSEIPFVIMRSSKKS